MGVKPLGPPRVSSLGIVPHLALGPGRPQLLPWEGKSVSHGTMQYSESPSSPESLPRPWQPWSLARLCSTNPTHNNLLSIVKEGRDSESQDMRDRDKQPKVEIGPREEKQLVQGHIGNLWPRN